MDQLKKLFKKKKQDVTFKNAGPGYKLTDNTSKVDNNPKPSTLERIEPSHEAKQAGMAALARFSESDKPYKKKSIMASMKTSMLSAENSDFVPSSCSTTNNLNEEEIIPNADRREVNPGLLVVQGVYYKCPIVGPEVLTKEEWILKIQEFLEEQLIIDKGLTACIMIQTLNHGSEKIKLCVDTLCVYLNNILENPEEEKYKKIRVNNRVFQEKVSKITGVVQFLEAAGFELKSITVNDKLEDFYVLCENNYSLEYIQVLIDALQCAEPITIELDRNPQVLSSSDAIRRVEIPNEFFSRTVDELKKEQQLRMDSLESSMQLKTKAMREKERLKDLKKYNYTVIRIRFPDGIYLQGTFNIYEPVRAIFEFINVSLDYDVPFILNLGVNQKLDKEHDEKTLLEMELVPAAVLNCVFLEKFNNDGPFLKEELLIKLQSM